MNLEKVKIIEIPSHQDERGILSAIEENVDIPFCIKRIFYIHHIKEKRGEHALKDTDELLIPISGSFVVRVYDDKTSKEFIMNDSTKGLFIPKLIFLEIFNFSDDAVCLVLANKKHDLNQYLRSREDYFSYLENLKYE